MANRYLIIGAGFSGCTLANRLVQLLPCHVDIWDERNHLGGNCHTSRDEKTDVMVHHYGPHIFNTDKKHIWDFVNTFSPFRPYVHRVKASVGNEIYSLPVNLHTINQFFKQSFTPETAKKHIASLADESIKQPANFEEQALKYIGADLYRAFFYGYTKKQWGCEPTELPASILQRIPVRFNYDDNYHNNHYTGIPVDGYTAVMEQMIANPNIRLFLSKKFDAAEDSAAYDHIFYTGALDGYFGYQLGRLGYRTVTFEKHHAHGDFQGVTQMNFCDESVPYTRITEHKHFTPWEQHNETVYFVEYSKETEPTDTPYYPKRLQADKTLLHQYRTLANEQKGVSFLGRLATYRYMDMHQVIDEALQFADRFSQAILTHQPPPVFPNQEG